MAESGSVVTPERFASGMTYEEYIGSIRRNRDKFEYNYAETAIGDEDARTLGDIVSQESGPAKVLALCEDWCIDCYRGLPVMARIAEAAGMELRILHRDRNRDIMREFQKDEQFNSIPVFIFYTRDHRHIAHWIERPALAHEQMHLVHQMFEGKSREEAQAEFDRFQEGEVWANWRRETVREIRELLTSVSS